MLIIYYKKTDYLKPHIWYNGATKYLFCQNLIQYYNKEKIGNIYDTVALSTI
jgi:hypothetical protein